MADSKPKQVKGQIKGPDRKANRRGAARLAAVQALYQWQEGEDQPADIVEQFLNVRTGEAG